MGLGLILNAHGAALRAGFPLNKIALADEGGGGGCVL